MTEDHKVWRKLMTSRYGPTKEEEEEEEEEEGIRMHITPKI